MESVKTPLKIVSCTNGTLQMHEDNIKKLTSTVDPTCQNYSTAFLTVIGPPISEAWFYTNLILNHFENRGTGSLMKFSNSGINNGRESPYLPGFSYDKFKAQKTEPSGIYAWPTPFLLQNYHGNIMLWIIYLHQNDSSKRTLTEHRVLTHLLHLICTRTIITASDLQHVQDYHFLNKSNDGSDIHLRKSVLYIFQTSSEPFRFYHYDNIFGKNLDDVKDLQEFSTFLKTVLFENYNSVSAAYLPNCNEKLHDKKGRLCMNEISHYQLDRVLKLIGDINNIRPQVFKNMLLEPSRIFQYLADCIETVSESGVIKAGKDGKKSFKIRKSLHTTFIRDKDKQLKKTRGSSYSHHNSDEKKYLSIILEKAHVDLQLFMQLKFCSYFLKFVETEPGHFIDNILGESYNDVLQNLGSYQQLSDNDSKNLQENLQVHCKALRNSYIESHKLLARFHAEIENYICTSFHSPEVFFDHKQFINMGNEILNQKKRLQPNDLAFDTCAQLLTTFLEHLKKFRENEENLINTAVGLLANEYKEYMNNLVPKYPVCPNFLKKLHLKLSEKFVVAFCFSVYPKYSNKDQNPLLFDIQKRISSIYRGYKDANTAKLKNGHETIHHFITEEKKNYCEKMEKILQQNADGLNLQEMHEKCWADGVTNFESNVSRIGSEVPTTKYVATLNAHINKYWKSYQRKKDSSRVKKEKSSNQIQQHLPNGQQKPSTISAPMMLQKPIIFQLSLSEIVAAVSTGNEIEILHIEELHFAITSNGSWICGNAVRTDTIHKKPMQITNIWDYEKLNVKSKTENNLTTESVLGFLLATLKHKIEAELNGVIANCLVIIPFWFTSFQRQQIVDSGKIAGFDNVMLINENTAIALYAAEQERMQNRCSQVFVVSENSNWVDGTVYSFDQNAIKMISHCGNYNIGPNTRKLVPEACITAEVESKPASRSSWGRIAGKNGNKMNGKVLYTSFENASWEKTLSEVRGHLRSVIEVGEKGDWGKQLALNGALYFYQQFLNQRIVIAQEWVSSTIFLSIKSKNHTLFTKGGNYILPVFGGKKVIASQLPGRITEIEICQKVDKVKGQTQLGIFQLRSKLKQPCPCQVELDYQGIVSVLHTQQDKFTWRSCNLSDSQIALAKNKVEARTKVSAVENEGIDELVRKLKQFQTLIVARKVEFLSKTAEIEVQNQIMEYIQILYSPTTPETFKNISVTYEALRKKYIKKSMYI